MVRRASGLVTAAERAKARGWDVEPTEQRNPKGIALAIAVRRKNLAALIEAEKRRKNA